MDNMITMAKWQREILSFKGIKSTFIIEGNINDEYPFYTSADGVTEVNDFYKLNQLIWSLFEDGETNGRYDFLFCDPLFGFSAPEFAGSVNEEDVKAMLSGIEGNVQEKKQLIQRLNGKILGNTQYSNENIVRISECVRTALTARPNKEIPREQWKSKAVIVNFASRLLSGPDGLSQDEIAVFLNFMRASTEAIKVDRYRNTLILVVDKINDIPTWVYYNNPNVRVISISNPEKIVRNAYVNRYFKAFSHENEDKELDKIKEHFVDLTDGMKIIEIDELRKLFDKSDLPVKNIADVVSIYKYGFKDDQWAQVRSKVADNFKARIQERVKGQDAAVDQIARVIKRASTGLSGMQHSSGSNKPRGILFLAGPTGTGKTEVVKAVTELLYGDERRCIRFDMSEYNAENADQKLFGAPPGYVGYDKGGQLTNAIKENPFSILLFDEIEKAHSSIMDKFLQILEDGRMTDGQGNTVYFSEALIFFTSNVGISVETKDADGKVTGRTNLVNPGDKYEIVEDKIKQAMGVYFKPEVLNRIGNNIVVFNYLDDEAAKLIVDSQIRKINQNVEKRHEIKIEMSNQVTEYFYRQAWNDDVRYNGGRGIGNMVETHYLNPLAEFVFDQNCASGDVIETSIRNEQLNFARKTT